MSSGLNVIALTGFRQVGKDFLLKSFIENHPELDIRRVSFSDELKVLANHIFPWLPVDIHPDIKDLPFEHPKNINGYTPRDIWKLIANDQTGICHVQPDVLVDLFKQSHFSSLQHEDLKGAIFVISDLRKLAEYELTKEVNCPIVRILEEGRNDVSKEDSVEREIPNFEAVAEFTNQKDPMSVLEFDALFMSLLQRFFGV